MRAFILAGLAAVLSLQAQPAVQRFTLPNGLQVLHLEDHEQPLVRAWLHLDLEPGDTPPGRQGLAPLTLRMFSHSDAADLKAEDFDRVLDDAGIQLTQASDPKGLTWRLVSRSRDQDRALGMLADRLLRTVFDPSILGTQRHACWLQETRPGDPPREALRRALTQDPAARPTLKSLGAITMGDLGTFRARVVRPDRAVLVLHGDLGLEQAKRLVLLTLGTWTAPAAPLEAKPASNAAPAPAPASPPAEDPLQILAPGTELRVEAAAPQPGQVSPEVAGLLDLLLPGDANLAPVRLALVADCLVATLDGASGASAWTQLQAPLEALRKRGFTPLDMDRARKAWLARRSLDSLHPDAQMASALAEARGRGTSADRAKGLSLEALNAGLRSWLDPSTFRHGAVGDPDQLKGLAKP